MSFPTRLLEGYQHAVVSLTDEQAKIVVAVGDLGVGRLANDLGRRCPGAAVKAITPGHYTIEHKAFRGDLTVCQLCPGAALLEVRAPGLEFRNSQTLGTRRRGR